MVEAGVSQIARMASEVAVDEALLEARFEAIGTGTILTDGEWAWPDTLSHYVEKYHLELPQEFVRHATSAEFTIPDVTVDDLRRLQLPT